MPGAGQGTSASTIPRPRYSQTAIGTTTSSKAKILRTGSGRFISGLRTVCIQSSFLVVSETFALASPTATRTSLDRRTKAGQTPRREPKAGLPPMGVSASVAGVSDTSLRQRVIEVCLQLEARGLNQGTSGNVSVRDESGTGFYLTPSSVPYDTMVPADLVHVDLATGAVTGARKPSSELPFHLAILRARPDAQAVVHTHSLHATAVACLRRDLPAVHYLVGLFGGAQIRCAPYATFGTDELSAHVVAALADRRAALMANHGLVVIGQNLEQALALTAEAETLAKLYLQTLAAGTPHILPDDEMDRVIERFRDFGYGPVER